jgi:aminoglycoside 2'-N-acetyltransferase I
VVDIAVFRTPDAPPGVLQHGREMVHDAFDGDFSHADWEHALGGWHVVVTDNEQVLSHAAVVPRTIEFGERPLQSGYVEAVATAPVAQRRGHGSQAMVHVTEIIRRHFDVGVLSTSRHRFYERLGWERWRGPSFVVRDGRRLRTEKEDDGIMVLRFGASSCVSLTLPLACRARSGDDW